MKAELASELPATRSASGYTGKAIVDPINDLIECLKARGMLDVAGSDNKDYAHGMAQPAVLALKQDGIVVFRLAILPCLVGRLMPNMLRANKA